MIIPIRRARVIIRPFANFVVYPFLIANPETRVPSAFKIQKIGIETIFTIKGPTTGIAAIRALNPTNISVKIVNRNVANTRIFLSIPK